MPCGHDPNVVVVQKLAGNPPPDALSGTYATQESPDRLMPDEVNTRLKPEPTSVGLEEREVELIISGKRKRKGKGRATSGSPTDRETQTATRSKPLTKKNTTRGRKDMFLAPQGTAKKFYIMIHLKNRLSLVKIVRVPSNRIF